MRWERGLATLALLGLALTVFLSKSEMSTLPSVDTATLGAVALSTAQEGLTPKLPMAADSGFEYWGKPYFNDYPFPFQWMSGKLMRALGPTSWSGRLLTAVFSVACLAMTLALGASMHSFVTGLLAAIMLLLNQQFIRDGLNSHMDNAMSVFILGSVWAWSRQKTGLAGVLSGLGVWIKSPIALLLVPVAWLDYLISWVRARKRPSSIAPVIRLSLIALVTASGVWILTGIIGGFELVSDYWIRQVWGTAVSGRGGQVERDVWLFFKILRYKLLPWSPLILVSLAWHLWTRNFQNRNIRLLTFSALIVVVVVSFVRFKYDHYFVPAYPFLMILAAWPVGQWITQNIGREIKLLRGFVVVSGIAIVGVGTTPLRLMPESFPALQNFMTVMQSHGACDDSVGVLPSGLPYGNFIDYRDEIYFYTGRRARLLTCTDTALTRDALQAHTWVVGLEPEINRCIPKSEFPYAVRFGQMLLLSRHRLNERDSQGRLVTDYSPLVRAHHAVVECVPREWPKDSYHGPAPERSQ